MFTPCLFRKGSPGKGSPAAPGGAVSPGGGYPVTGPRPRSRKACPGLRPTGCSVSRAPALDQRSPLRKVSPPRASASSDPSGRAQSPGPFPRGRHPLQPPHGAGCGPGPTAGQPSPPSTQTWAPRSPRPWCPEDRPLDQSAFARPPENPSPQPCDARPGAEGGAGATPCLGEGGGEGGKGGWVLGRQGP